MVAVPTVRPEASRIVVRSEVPVICVVAEPALRPLPSVRVVLSVLDCAIAVVTRGSSTFSVGGPLGALFFDGQWLPRTGM